MKFIDLFAGIGGFRRGMELAGHECVGFCEFDKFATASYTAMHCCTDEQLAYLATLPLKERQKEILNEEYRNGEWYCKDICEVTGDSVPKVDCWCFGAPCQDFSVAGLGAGLSGNRSSLVREVFRIAGEMREEDRPEWLIYENVKGMLSSNRGFDFLAILLEMDELGYDCEWFLFNSKYHGVPQNRERVYLVGHLRSRGGQKIFPIKGTDEANSVPIKIIAHHKSYRRNTQVFMPDGITETLSTCQGGGREHYTALPIRFGSQIECIDRQGRRNKKVAPQEIAPTLRAQIHGNAPEVLVPIKEETPSVVSFSRGMLGDELENAHCLSASGPAKEGMRTHQAMNRVVIPVLTPERAEKRQNGRRFKDDGEPAFTLTSIDRHGVAIGVDTEDDYDSDTITVQINDQLTVAAIWYEKYQCYVAIRRLTPKECFRLQGWDDDYFAKAELVNSDSQLYKQAGNGVTVNVVEIIGKAIKICEEDLCY